MWTGMDSYMSCDVRSSMVNGMYRRHLVPMVQVRILAAEQLTHEI